MRIGEVAKSTGLKVDTIRFYEMEGLVADAGRSKANYRVYGQEQVNRLSFIKRSRDLGFTLEQVRELLRITDDPLGSCAEVDAIASNHLEAIDQKLAALTAMRGELLARLERCVGRSIAGCAVISELRSDKGRQ